MKLNLLKLNQDKTEPIIFAPKHRSQEFTCCQLEFDGSLVREAFCVKDLGVFFYKTLDMEKQGSSLAKSCFFQIRNIERIRPYISNDASITLVSALVTSRFDSGNALSFGVNASLITKLQRIQNTAARLITRTKNVSTSHLFSWIYTGFLFAR